MPITELYSDYFQKSKTFLLPAIGIRKSDQTSGIMTFISWSDKYTPNDYRLIVCKSGDLDDHGFRKFEQIFLVTNAYFETMEQVDRKTIAYIFNLEKFRDDWDLFLEGKYSKLSPLLKSRIKQYHGETTIEWEYIRSFLYPHRYYDLYADLLYDDKDRERGLEYLRSIGELCGKWDKEMETLKFSETHISF